MKPADLISEARAQIIWGEPASSVRNFLTGNGIPGPDADAALDQFNAERNSEIRKVGFKKTSLGAALTIAAGIFFCLSFLHIDIDKIEDRRARGFVMIAIVVALGGFYGIWLLMAGITYLVRPQSEEKSICEIS